MKRKVKNNMKKLIMIIIFLTIKTVSFGQEEVSYYANKDDYLYEDFYSDASETNGKIYKGEPLISIEGNIRIVNTADIRTKRVKVETEDNEGWLYTNSISIVGSEILPDEITENEWTNSYYLDVMQQGNKDVLFSYEPFWRDSFYKYKNYFNDQSVTQEWYKIAYIPPFEFGNIYAGLYFCAYNRYYFIFEKISINNKAFSFQAICTDKRIVFDETDTGKLFTLNKKYNMMLKLDGDYLDVYVDGKKTFSLIKLTKEIKEQFENLLEYNRCDLTKITFPKRANGSMDYSPLDNSNSLDNINSYVQQDKITQTNDKDRSMPLWAWIAIIGGAAVIVGGAAVFVIMRRK
jgi:hypothetical protein